MTWDDIQSIDETPTTLGEDGSIDAVLVRVEVDGQEYFYVRPTAREVREHREWLAMVGGSP